MHDTLDYFAHDPVHRRYHHNELTFSADLRLHRELHPAALARRGRARQGLAARRRCRATAGSSFANLRALYGYMWAHPGKKLLFMGGEFAQEARVEPRALASTGTCSSSPSTPASRRSCATSTALYRAEPALWERDFDAGGLRAGSRPTTPPPTCSRSRALGDDGARRVVCVCNFSPVVRERLPHRPAARRALARAPEHRRGRATAAATSATAAVDAPSRARGTASRTRPSSRCRRSR